MRHVNEYLYSLYGWFDLWFYRYNELQDDGALAECVNDGSQSKKFSCLVAWLTSELASYCGIDDHVSAVAGKQISCELNGD